MLRQRHDFPSLLIGTCAPRLQMRKGNCIIVVTYTMGVRAAYRQTPGVLPIFQERFGELSSLSGASSIRDIPPDWLAKFLLLGLISCPMRFRAGLQQHMTSRHEFARRWDQPYWLCHAD